MKIKFEDTTERLDKYIIQLGIDEVYSRSYVNKLMLDGYIKVNGNIEKKSYKLVPGDEIEIILPEKKNDFSVEPQDLPLEIIYQDDYLAIVNKPAGMTVHPAPGNPNNTLVNAVAFHLNGQLSCGATRYRPGIVHRLDKDTTGLLVIAKDDKTHALLSDLFQKRKIDKYYLAITSGVPKESEGTIDTMIGRSSLDRKKMAVVEEGKRAITHYEIEEYFDFFSLVKIKLETGRTHQIRVHFSHLNCPILGDETYSTLKRTLNHIPSNYQKKLKHLLANNLKRQALHAYQLEFDHPITGEHILATAPLPEDMEYALNWLRKFFVTS
ncbi:MAG: RluA family pseudouridine synthase [Candidatus Cloacimonetes bacterium]|nr:RluA family pseudouridine synthase [Candidatus Cloacimonadota bacterium]